MQCVFTYGSLMFPEVLEIILGRPASELHLCDAILNGYRRIAVPHEAYPTAVVAPGYRIEGKLINGITHAELQLLDAYEGRSYVRVPISVVTNDGERTAYMYRDARDKLPFALRDWDEKLFLRRQLQEYMRQLRKESKAQK